MVLKCLAFLHGYAKMQLPALLCRKTLFLQLPHVSLMLLHDGGYLIGGSVLGNIRNILAPVWILLGAIVPIPHLAHRDKVRRMVLDKLHETLLHLVLIALHDSTHGHTANIGYRVISLGASAISLFQSRRKCRTLVAAANIVIQVAGCVFLPSAQGEVVVKHPLHLLVVLLADDTALVRLLKRPLRRLVDLVPELINLSLALHRIHDFLSLSLSILYILHARQLSKAGVVTLAVGIVEVIIVLVHEVIHRLLCVRVRLLVGIILLLLLCLVLFPSLLGVACSKYPVALQSVLGHHVGRHIAYAHFGRLRDSIYGLQ